ncbi:MAG TPA: hypothetical protein VIR82_06610 [Bradyrhizobium sp.]
MRKVTCDYVREGIETNRDAQMFADPRAVSVNPRRIPIQTPSAEICRLLIACAQNESAGCKSRRLDDLALEARLLLSVLLDARGAQAGEAVLVDGILPGEKFLDR